MPPYSRFADGPDRPRSAIAPSLHFLLLSDMHDHPSSWPRGEGKEPPSVWMIAGIVKRW